ncbi:hypothetical protein [Jiella avicenniae]|uniref:Uncharacterized protein n=1 Tax=Jiella avicenniae TaxID=2907202 RepID=A0A9X1P0W1_9HYPH|nr:hypothetical protein [Jiella avicenniae]MCE7028478.1 hypothetical protein [Jiella avicenniae]
MDDFDLDQIDAADEAEMRVIANGNPTEWIWRFAGPGHDRTIAQTNRLSRERLHRDREQEQARVNGKKWKAPDESVDEIRERNVKFVTDRLLGWSPVKMGGEDYPFTPENAKKLLLDRRKSALLVQALEFLGEDQSFTKTSAIG